MKKTKIYLIISAVAILLLIITNPDETTHIESVKTKLKSAFKKEMSKKLINDKNENSFSSLGNGLGLLLGDTFIDKMTDGFISRKNYYIFSLTNAEIDGNEKIIGFGVLGNVFLSEKMDNAFKDKLVF
ncbi:DUF4359 domain-containing protein [Flavobacterium psychrophilum]|uniref:DUF4359 domain-containing protein n=1 Tax=Flavobacterium psychrophilum TaxID=96345 RepID=UPI003138689C